MSNGLQNGHVHSPVTPVQSHHHQLEGVPEATQVGAGQGGEGAGDGKGPPNRRNRETGRDATHHGWRERTLLPPVIPGNSCGYMCSQHRD